MTFSLLYDKIIAVYFLNRYLFIFDVFFYKEIYIKILYQEIYAREDIDAYADK